MRRPIGRWRQCRETRLIILKPKIAVSRRKRGSSATRSDNIPHTKEGSKFFFFSFLSLRVCARGMNKQGIYVIPSLPHKFYKNSMKLKETKSEKKMLPGAQKKREKNNCSRFPSVFLILVFSLFLIFFVFVYSLVAPSEKRKIESAPAERSSDRRKDSFGTMIREQGSCSSLTRYVPLLIFSFFFSAILVSHSCVMRLFILPTVRESVALPVRTHGHTAVSIRRSRACDFSCLRRYRSFRNNAHTPRKKLCFIPNIKQRYTTADNRSDAAFSPAVVSFVFRCSLR